MSVGQGRAEALCVDGYVRVSQVGGRSGERFISPVVQREAIERWAETRGARILEVFEELDEPGGRADRPLFLRALERIRLGVSDGIVVSNADRFGRSVVSGAAAIAQITDAGGKVFAIENGLDTSTYTGRLVVHILLSMAQWQSERLRADWEKAHAKAIERGVYGGSGTPVGYRRASSGRLRPDPRTAGFVAEAFHRRAAGETVSSIGRWLETQGVRRDTGNRGWRFNATVLMLRNRVYLGEVRWARYVKEGAHPAIVDEATWEAAQYPARAVVHHKREPALLARLARCSGCSMAMAAIWRRDPRCYGLHYFCPVHSAAGRCPAPASIAADYLEAYVEEHVFGLLRHRRGEHTWELAQAEQTLDSASGALARYRDSDRILDTLGTDAFLAGLAARKERVRAALLKVAAIRDANAILALPSVEELERQWPEMDDQARRSIIATVIDCVFVTKGWLHIEDRVTICRAGTAPTLPGITNHAAQARPFVPKRKHRLPTRKPWPAKRIERELTEFLDGQRIWPSADAFTAAGRRRLYDQVQRHAGAACWAHHFGLPAFERPRHSRYGWTDERIREALKLYLRRKRRFPTHNDFAADGVSSLYTAIQHSGGLRRWNAEFGLPTTAKQRAAGLAQQARHAKPPPTR